MKKIALASHAGIDGGITAITNGQMIMFSRDGAGNVIPSGTQIVLLLEHIMNPSKAGGTGVFDLQTKTFSGSALDSAGNIPESNITTDPAVPVTDPAVPVNKVAGVNTNSGVNKVALGAGLALALLVLLFCLWVFCCRSCFGFCGTPAPAAIRGPCLKFVIEGHTNIAAPENKILVKELSQKRAEAVKSALIRQGVPEQALSTEGFGDTQPVVLDLAAPNASENMRVTTRLENLHELGDVIDRIKRADSNFHPQDRGFIRQGAPDVRLSFSEGHMMHEPIKFGDRSWEILPQSWDTVKQIATAIKFLEENVGVHTDTGEVGYGANADPVGYGELDKEFSSEV